jgi:TRAP transporter TAXI family solute receptor
VGLGASALVDLASTRNMLLVCMTDTEIDAVTQAFPYYSAFNIPGGTYPGFDEDCPTIQVANHLFVKADADPGLVYQMTKILFENQPKLAQTSAAAAVVSPEYAMASTVIPLHPGALRYFDEIGIDVPKSLRPGSN